MVGDEHSLKVSAPQLLWFVIDSVLRFEKKKGLLNQSVIEIIKDKGVYSTAPATPGLLIT